MTDLSRFQDAAGHWLGPEEWPSVQAEVTCRTSGCPAEGRAHVVTVHENVDGSYAVECGPCGQAPEIRVVGS